MSEPQSPELNPQHVRAALAAARADVLGSLEKGKSLPQAEILELRRTVDEAISAYESLLKAAPAERRPELEHTLGRQVIDLRRVAAMVPQMASGTATKHSADKVPGGGQPFIETRPPPRWATVQTAPSVRAHGHLKPGDEVDAWCGVCGGLRAHNIVAMIGKEPKQVLCQACGARHGYRLTPARSKPADQPAAPKQTVQASKRKKTPQEMQEERRQQELSRLKAELDAAQGVIAFDQRRRYKAGEIIDHPEYGRGKIETALKSSIVVRFATGRRSLVLK